MTCEHIGPALTAVRLADPGSVAALFQEQRARLKVVRDNRIWQWFGGVPSGFCSLRSELRACYLRFAALALMAIALITAGMTRGPVLWIVSASCVVCLVTAWCLDGPASRRTLQLYRRAVQIPAFVVAHAPEGADPDGRRQQLVYVVTAFDADSAFGLRRLAAAATKLRSWLAGSPAPSELATFVAALQQDFASRRGDGSRTPVPTALGSGLEVAQLRINPALLPDEELTSALLFVFADPERREAGHTRMVQSSHWGTGVETLCAEFPLRGVA